MGGFNKQKKSSGVYPSLDSAIRPVLHCDEVPIPNRVNGFIRTRDRFDGGDPNRKMTHFRRQRRRKF